jgi:hypothetical protein
MSGLIQGGTYVSANVESSFVRGDGGVLDGEGGEMGGVVCSTPEVLGTKSLTTSMKVVRKG